MKMKEVCEKTGLTDRAVRLYIENGLVSPKYNENYMGRRNIDFSLEDVSTLKDISVLRKASFSIAEIKELKSNPENAKEVLKTVIGNTEKRIEMDTEVVSCLMPLLGKERVGIEDICQSLENGTIDNKDVPKEDTETPFVLKIFKNVFSVIGLICLVLNSHCLLSILRDEIYDFKHYLYPRYSIFAVIIVLLLLLLPLYFMFSRSPVKYNKKKIMVRTVFSSAIMCFLVWATIVLSLMSWFSILDDETFVFSQTTKTENYMVFDDKKAKDALSEFLPENLPDDQKVKYKYYYKTYGSNPVFPETDVFIEFSLAEKDFRNTVKYYTDFRPEDSINEPRTFEKGSWKIICYREDGENAPSNYEALFAYNEEREEVRLICRYGNVAVKGAITAEFWIDDYKW